MSESYRKLYEILNKAIYTQSESIDITGILPPSAIVTESLNTILKAILDCHPQYFWFEGKWRISNTDGRIIIRPAYGFDSKSRIAFTKRIDEVSDAAIEEILAAFDTVSGCPPDETLLIKAVYGWILDNIKYGKGKRGGQTVFDALIDGEALCKGLSKTLQLLLSKLGIRSRLRAGSIDGVTRHIWNTVEIEGRSYNIDVSMGYELFDHLYQGSRADRRERAYLVSDEELTVLV